jgi:hypothetical protein
MATRRYSIAKGETEFKITEAVGAATATKSMEFTFDLAANLTKNDILQGLRMIENWILKGNFPPA